MSRKTTSRTKSTAVARMQWNEDAARELVGELQASGETVAEYARKRGLNAWVLYDWRRRLGMREQPRLASSEPATHATALARSAFLPVRVSRRHVPVAPSSEPLEVVLGSGRVVRVPPSFDGAALRRLVSVLEEVSR